MSSRGAEHLWSEAKGPFHNLEYLSQLADNAEEDLSHLFRSIFHGGMHGLCFSLYKEGQKPGDIISEDQVRNRLKILKPHSDWVRSFSCTEGNEYIPIIAKELGMKTLVGAWIGHDNKVNKREIEGLKKLMQQGYVDIAAVGNEALYRKDLTEKELIKYLSDVKDVSKDIPVGYVDAYYEFSQRPALAEACDVILCNCYPYWEGCPVEYSLQHMQSMYYQAREAAKGKRVIITETGWPSQGAAFETSIPSVRNAMQYYINTQMWCQDNDIDLFYFSSFDEPWKIGPEGDVGAHWGLWDKKESLKY